MYAERLGDDAPVIRAKAKLCVACQSKQEKADQPWRVLRARRTKT
jgi:hypothetical protein